MLIALTPEEIATIRSAATFVRTKPRQAADTSLVRGLDALARRVSGTLAPTNSNLAMLAAEVAFKSCEEGENWEATVIKLRGLLAEKANG